MNKNDKKPFYLSSFEDASIIRKFTILFLLSSIVPMVLLYFIYFQHNKNGHIDLNENSFRLAMFFMALGVFVGYYSIRSMLKKVIDITENNRKALEKVLSPETIQQLNQGENEIAVLSRSFSVVTSQLEENIKSLESAKKTLQSVMEKVGQGISNMERIDTFLNLILETMTNALNGRVSTLMLLNDQKTELTVNNVFGVDYNPLLREPLQIKLFQGSPFLKTLEEKKPVTVSGIFLQNLNNPELSKLFGESILCVPLIYRDKTQGILTLTKHKNNNETFSPDDINLIFNLASQTAVALENSKLNNDIEKTYFETISALALAVDAKDKYSRGHLDRVAQYVLLIGKKLGLDNDDLHTLRDAAKLHDLGKLGIPDEILCKESELTPEEWIIMRRHPEIGESIIRPVHSLQPLCDIIRHHHEKLDGTGYPDQLKAEEISPLVRILTVADVYDALTTERPYRSKKTRLEAMHVLRTMKNKIDQDIVDIFLESLQTSPLIEK